MLAALALCTLSPVQLQQPPERVHALFIGDHGHHRPAERLHVVWGPLARSGVVVDWEDRLEHVTPGVLEHYDCVILYANQAEHRTVPPAFLRTLRGWVQGGGGLVALHCASGCFPASPQWAKFVGAHFARHGGEVFAQEIVAPEHPIVAGWEPFESWDETYEHRNHNDDGRTVLTVRDGEPWTWVRDEGEGRVFYTASGHDLRTWEQPGFLDLLIRAIDWTTGDEIAARRRRFALPELAREPRDMVPNYEGREPRTEYQLPSTPEQAQAHLQAPAGFRVELFAAEPTIVNPIAISWDARGRAWVLETPDYPNDVAPDEKGNDRVVILEDTDDDGRADRRSTFADGLNIPSGLLPVEGGVLVACAPRLLFLRDDDGDDRCDGVETLLDGFGRRDTHAGPSNLHWGPDNALWGAIGYSGYRDDARGVRFGQGLWRWPFDGAPELVAQFSNNTWGLGFRSDGEVFGSTANAAPAFFMGVPHPLLARSSRASARPVHDGERIHPAAAEIRQGDWLGGFTAAAGFAIATGDGLPPGWSDEMAFVCEPTGHLVARFRIERDGAGYRTRDAFNLVASTDAWFCPVQCEVGPDGAIWIADFAQFIILHNLPGNPERGLPKVEYGPGNAHRNPMRDREHGRIWRLVPERGAQPAPTDDLLALEHPNRFWRTQARMRIVERREPEVVAALRASQSVDALRALAGLGQLDRELLASALADPARRVAALAAVPATAAGVELLATSGALEDDDPIVRRHALVAAARMPEDPRLGVLLASRAVLEDPGDEWLATALEAAVVAHAPAFVAAAEPLAPPPDPGEPENLMPNPGFEQVDADDAAMPAGWRPRTYSGTTAHRYERAGGRSGACVVMDSDEGVDSSWFRSVPVEPSTRYRFSGWIRAERLERIENAHGALFNLHARRYTVTDRVREPGDWTEVAMEFATDPDEHVVEVNCLLGGWGRAKGVVRYDDLRLVRLGPANGLVDLLRLARSRIDASSTVEATSTTELIDGGDASRGRRVFFEHEVAVCWRCHALDGRAGGVGPDLTGVGTRLTRAEILESILEPNAKIANGWPAPVSAMPALRSFLSDDEIRDLVAFLATQK